MSKFKVGDIVQRVRGGDSGLSVKEGGVYTVTRISSAYNNGQTISVNTDHPRHFSKHFELYQPEPKCKCICAEDAKRILEAQGYTVTPPPEPESGVAHIYKYPSGEISIRNTTFKSDLGAKLIAIVPWTEGQGL